jgi:hypothetical protein
MSGVFIQTLMFEAEQQQATLRADCNYMENYKALEEIKAFEGLAAPGGESFSLQKKKAASKLPTLGSAMLMAQQETAEVAQLREENQAVKKMMQAMQDKMQVALLGKLKVTEKAETQEAEELQRRLDRAMEERDRAVEEAEALRKEAAGVKQEMQKKVN